MGWYVCYKDRLDLLAQQSENNIELVIEQTVQAVDCIQ